MDLLRQDLKRKGTLTTQARDSGTTVSSTLLTHVMFLDLACPLRLTHPSLIHLSECSGCKGKDDCCLRRIYGYGFLVLLI